jgi:hypothetical protein
MLLRVMCLLLRREMGGGSWGVVKCFLSCTCLAGRGIFVA